MRTPQQTFFFSSRALAASLALAWLAAGCSPKAPEAPSAPAAPAVEPSPAPAAVAEPAPSTQAPANDAAAPAADGPISRFTAEGFSPAWRVEVKGDNDIAFEVPETMGPDSAMRSASVTRSAYAKGVNYDGKDGDVAFTLDIRSQDCEKTGSKTPFTATFTYGKSVYKGCAQAAQ